MNSTFKVRTEYIIKACEYNLWLIPFILLSLIVDNSYLNIDPWPKILIVGYVLTTIPLIWLIVEYLIFSKPKRLTIDFYNRNFHTESTTINFSDVTEARLVQTNNNFGNQIPYFSWQAGKFYCYKFRTTKDFTIILTCLMMSQKDKKKLDQAFENKLEVINKFFPLI